MMSMKKLSAVVSGLFFFLILTSCSGEVKEPAVAGSFYPADRKQLKEMVDGFIAGVENRNDSGRLIALISPHAGYQFSGAVAANSYSRLKGRDIKTVIIIGQSHYAAFKGASVYAKGGMKTPLGNIKINEKIAASLLDEKADVRFTPGVYEKEHSIEVQLPFLQESLKDFSVVPILIGSPTRALFDHLTNKLIQAMAGDDHIMIVASTDLSHYHDYDTAVTMDRKIIASIENMAIGDIEKYLSAGEAEMCGGYPVIFTISVARGLGATNGTLFKYANSGDVTGDRGRVVGYAAMGLYKDRLAQKERDFLLSLAKKTIVEYVTNNKTPEISATDAGTLSPRLSANGATFVTINRNGHLRGCIGNMQPVMPLYQSVISNAVSASSRDYRFPPMNKEELHDMEVEISVLSPFEVLKNIKDIEIGKHGLYLVTERASSVFLPQVPVEQRWDLNTYLEELSLKAGLARNAWKTAKLYTFTADIIK